MIDNTWISEQIRSGRLSLADAEVRQIIREMLPRTRQTPPGTRQRSVSFRAAPELGDGVVVGRVTSYGNAYNIGAGVKELIVRGAFDRAVGGVIPVFWSHDWDAGPIGISRSITSSASGLDVTAELFLDDPKVRNVYRSLQAGALRAWSVGFRATRTEWDKTDNRIERILEADLIEASVVVRGANPQAQNLATRSN
jgi:HK97 family phage prohead protease